MELKVITTIDRDKAADSYVSHRSQTILLGRDIRRGSKYKRALLVCTVIHAGGFIDVPLSDAPTVMYSVRVGTDAEFSGNSYTAARAFLESL